MKAIWQNARWLLVSTLRLLVGHGASGAVAERLPAYRSRVTAGALLAVVAAVTFSFSSAAQRPSPSNPAVRRIVPGDRILVKVVEDSDLSRVYPVLGDGTIEMSYAGRISVADKTFPLAAQEIQRRLEESLFRKATVSVEPSEFVEGAVMVMGAIGGGPRSIPFDSGQLMTLTDALLAAGWLSARANARDVRILRWSAEGGMQREIISVDVQHIMDTYDFSTDHYLQPRDWIIVQSVGEGEDSLEFLALGEVGRMGFHPWKENLDMIRAITTVGGYSRDARLDSVRILRPDGAGGVTAIPVDLTVLLAGNMSENRKILPGDMLYFPSSSTAKSGQVILLGEVNNQGSYDLPLTGSMTLARLILMRGGAKEFANLRRVRVNRTAPDGSKQTLVYDVKEILDSGQFEQDLPLRDQDVIIVPSRTFGL